MRIVGLAGGSATGKSTIAAHLSRRGAAHVDADRVGHGLLENNRTVIARIRRRFGDAVFAGGAVDRRALAEVVFSAPAALEDLNAIIHPAIVDACAKRLERLRRNGVRLAVLDAALLLEAELPFEVDLMLALRCSPEEQMRRLEAKGGLSRPQIEARLRSQSALEKAFYRADVVVDTGRPLDEVLEEIDRLVDGLWTSGSA